MTDITNKFHGHSRKNQWSPEYFSWASMIQRCTNPNRNNYKLYGGRGIKVCNRWLDFRNFLEDMGTRPENTTLNRIDNDGNYEPLNCEWGPLNKQAQNTRNTKLTVEQVREIKSLYITGKSSRQLAQIYRVSKTTILKIVNEISWTNIEVGC